MNNPFEVLGLKGWADQDEIRTAYRTLVKQCHPDMIQDPLLKRIRPCSPETMGDVRIRSLPAARPK